MKIGIIGAGTVGMALAKAWALKHRIYIGTRNPKKPELKTLLEEAPNMRIGTYAQAAESSDIILLAINPWSEIEPALSPIKHFLRGKTVIDVSNNIVFKPGPSLAFTDESMGEYIQNILPDTHVVKTLNVALASIMVKPHESGIRPAVTWISGNNTEAKQKAAALVKDLGWDEVVDIGDIHKSVLQENIGLITMNIVHTLSQQK